MNANLAKRLSQKSTNDPVLNDVLDKIYTRTKDHEFSIMLEVLDESRGSHIYNALVQWGYNCTQAFSFKNSVYMVITWA